MQCGVNFTGPKFAFVVRNALYKYPLGSDRECFFVFPVWPKCLFLHSPFRNPKSAFEPSPICRFFKNQQPMSIVKFYPTTFTYGFLVTPRESNRKGFDNDVNNPEKDMGYENLCQSYSKYT